ncbi:MAG: ATP-binding protein [Oligoflexus sp.]
MNWDPKTESPHFIYDREKLLTIIRNLPGNTFKFSQAQSQYAINCHINFENRLTIEVRDQGIGIPDHEKDTIFTEFKQVQEDARRAYEGWVVYDDTDLVYSARF